MAFRQPVADQITYTSAQAPTAVVQPGRLRVSAAATISLMRAQFAAALGPVGGAFTCRWLLNGATLGTITVADGAVAGSAVPSTAALVAGDLLTFEVLGLGGATGAVVGILDITRP